MNWFRGQLHAHSYWSDGRGFPEQAINAYRQRGYQFLCISDHNRFADDPQAWREVCDQEGSWPPKISRAIFETYRAAFDESWVETKRNGSSTQVRLKTYDELVARFEEPGRFLLISGGEMTQQIDTTHVHMNYINLPLLPRSVQGANLVQKLDASASVSGLIAHNVGEIEQLANTTQRPCLLMLNHPFTFFCDILPQHLIDCPDVRFFEICNNVAYHPPHSEARNYEPEKFWDAVNAFRRLEDQPLLYGVGSDDAHFYDAARIGDRSGVGDAWVMVRADELTTEHVLAAMHRGAFYATCGVLLDEVSFDVTTGTLYVKVRPEQGVRYRIHFVTTKRDFDRRVAHVTSPPEGRRPERTLPIYSDDVGRTVKVVEASDATYQLEPDDLYVRARIESDRPSQVTGPFHPLTQTAWTQPYTTDGCSS